MTGLLLLLRKLRSPEKKQDPRPVKTDPIQVSSFIERLVKGCFPIPGIAACFVNGELHVWIPGSNPLVLPVGVPSGSLTEYSKMVIKAIRESEPFIARQELVKQFRLVPAK